jgi:hypothetical protein
VLRPGPLLLSNPPALLQLLDLWQQELELLK